MKTFLSKFIKNNRIPVNCNECSLGRYRLCTAKYNDSWCVQFWRSIYEDLKEINKKKVIPKCSLCSDTKSVKKVISPEGFLGEASCPLCCKEKRHEPHS